MSVDISVLIPTYNRKDTLLECLKLYGRQSFPRDRFEIVVIDDGSTDGTGDAVSSWRPYAPYPLIYARKENAGPAAARNFGIGKASGKIVFITGDDILPDAGLLAEHWKWHDTEYPLKNVGILGHVTWAPEPPPSPFMLWLEQGTQFAYHRIRHGEKLDWRYLYTCNISMKLEFLEQTGEILDERFPYAAYEDIEWGFRLAKKGFALMYNRNAAAFHHHFTTLESSFGRIEKVGRTMRSLKRINPELYEILMRDSSPKEGWKRVLLNAAVHPAVAEPLILPLARFFEHRGINRYIFDLAHRYFFFRGLDGTS
jgi:glycosyltransferase involved in cell wall biosynthesis